MRTVQPLPHDDQTMIEGICKEKIGWLGHQATWLQALSVYQLSGGNPWIVQPAVFANDIENDLKRLYETRRKGGHIKRIREYPLLGSCPLCGSLSTGSVDHFLPKAVFPEFSIYSLNLVPACPYCNSDEKGSIYIGEKAPARLIHPYFDKMGDKPILSVAFESPYDAVGIRAVPAPGLSGDELDIVAFHIGVLLGDAFVGFVRNLWASLPVNVISSLEHCAEVTPVDVQGEVQWLLDSNVITYGINSWPAGFYRGVLADAAVIDYVAQQATVALAGA